MSGSSSAIGLGGIASGTGAANGDTSSPSAPMESTAQSTSQLLRPLSFLQTTALDTPTATKTPPAPVTTGFGSGSTTVRTPTTAAGFGPVSSDTRVPTTSPAPEEATSSRRIATFNPPTTTSRPINGESTISNNTITETGTNPSSKFTHERLFDVPILSNLVSQSGNLASHWTVAGPRMFSSTLDNSSVYFEDPSKAYFTSHGANITSGEVGLNFEWTTRYLHGTVGNVNEGDYLGEIRMAHDNKTRPIYYNGEWASRGHIFEAASPEDEINQFSLASNFTGIMNVTDFTYGSNVTAETAPDKPLNVESVSFIDQSTMTRTRDTRVKFLGLWKVVNISQADAPDSFSAQFLEQNEGIVDTPAGDDVGDANSANGNVEMSVLFVTVPNNTTAIRLKGDLSHPPYNTELQEKGKAPLPVSMIQSRGPAGGEGLQWFIAIDPTRQYSFLLKQQAEPIRLSSVEFVSFYNQQNDSAPSIGAIVGATIGGIVGVILIGILVFYIRYTRWLKSQYNEHDPQGTQPLTNSPSGIFRGDPEAAAAPSQSTDGQMRMVPTASRPSTSRASISRSSADRPNTSRASDSRRGESGPFGPSDSQRRESRSSASRRDESRPSRRRREKAVHGYPSYSNEANTAGRGFEYPPTANRLPVVDPGLVAALKASVTHTPDPRRPLPLVPPTPTSPSQPTHPDPVAFEEDAGYLQPINVLPPNYNPRWAADRRVREEGGGEGEAVVSRDAEDASTRPSSPPSSAGHRA